MVDVDKIKIGQKVYKVEDCYSKTDYKGDRRTPKDYKIDVIGTVVIAIITTKNGKSYFCKGDRTTSFSDIINRETSDYIYEYDNFLAAMLKAKEQAIENHRKMWNWIADETLKRKRAVHKKEYFSANSISSFCIPFSECYCCEYNAANLGIGCNKCPIQ